MNAGQALRFLAHQARVCRDRDAMEAHMLLHPAILKLCDLEPMDDFEADCFLRDLKQRLARDANGDDAKPGRLAHLLK